MNGALFCENMGEEKSEGGVEMTGLGYPNECERNVKAVSDALCIDSDTAYTCLVLCSILTDLSPTDPELAKTVIAEYGRQNLAPVA